MAAAAAGVRAERLEAFLAARANGDPHDMAMAAVHLPSLQRFGVDPGQIPALIHCAYAAATSDADRARVAAALARAWVYGGDADRAPAFANEAVALARRTGDPVVMADALEAALVARWGPDHFAERLRLAAQLADTAAHLTDPELRLSAHLWRLTTAWESLDVVAVHRQLRALDLLAEDTGAPRVAFFAASRRAMHALVTGDLDAADGFIARTAELGTSFGEPDLDGVVHSLGASRARQVADVEALRFEASAYEAHGTAEGIVSVLAEACGLWLAAGEIERASELFEKVAGAGLGTVVRDVDFLLTLTCLVEVAVAIGSKDAIVEGAQLLEPYAGRGVLNAGAVTFHGVVDDYLHQAHGALGRGASASWRHAAAASYRRIGATWWEQRIQPGAARHVVAAPTVVHLHPDDAGAWTFGRDGATVSLPDRRGLHYLRFLVGTPGIDSTAVALSAAVAGRAPASAARSAGIELLDAQALNSYRRRLRDLDAELAEAESWFDEGRLDRLQRERDALLDEVKRATGLGGRQRRTGSTDERARVAVRKALAAALELIARHDPSLERLLRDTVHTGTSCRYEPDPARPVTWVLGTSPV
ncbi:MAG: hypothetical protein JWL70_1984 [Acidimicrobiia bacterium]|nr:hypothetical protein [Acidimicrobiia bacterium]